MIRTVIRIDSALCTGCGLCVDACHEGAIGLVAGKARLMRDDCCDGLGDCLPACPAGAISFEEREAAAFDRTAVEAARRASAPGAASELTTWPIQITHAPARASRFAGASLLVAADCTAFACADFHRAFMRGRVTLVGCPKLDGGDYAEKLGDILAANEVSSVAVARMEVPCCGGLERAVLAAVARCGKDVPVETAVISTNGELLELR